MANPILDLSMSQIIIGLNPNPISNPPSKAEANDDIILDTPTTVDTAPECANPALPTTSENHLMPLPPELRNKILRLAMSHHPTHLCLHTKTHQCPHFKTVPQRFTLPITFHISRQIRSEAASLFYGDRKILMRSAEYLRLDIEVVDKAHLKYIRRIEGRNLEMGKATALTRLRKTYRELVRHGVQVREDAIHIPYKGPVAEGERTMWLNKLC